MTVMSGPLGKTSRQFAMTVMGVWLVTEYLLHHSSKPIIEPANIPRLGHVVQAVVSGQAGAAVSGDGVPGEGAGGGGGAGEEGVEGEAEVDAFVEAAFAELFCRYVGA